jgi:hypothetical protein
MTSFSEPFSLIEVNAKMGYSPRGKLLLIWYRDGSKRNKDIGAWGHDYGTRSKLSFSLRIHASSCQAEVDAIKACTVENLYIDYKTEKSMIYQTVKLRSKLRITGLLDLDDCPIFQKLEKISKLDPFLSLGEVARYLLLDPLET